MSVQLSWPVTKIMSLPVRRSDNYGGEPSLWGRVTGDRTLADKGQWAAQPNECVKIHVRLFAQACALTINTHWRWVNSKAALQILAFGRQVALSRSQVMLPFPAFGRQSKHPN